MSVIKFKRGYGVPNTSDLTEFEPAINLASNGMYTKDESGEIVEIDIGYENKIQIEQKISNLMNKNISNISSLAKIQYEAQSQLLAKYAMMDNLFVETFRDTSFIDENLSFNYVFENGSIKSDQVVYLGGGTGGTTGQSSYTSTQGYVISSNRAVYNNSNFYYMSYMFNKTISGGATNYWLTSGGQVNSDALVFNFTSNRY